MTAADKILAMTARAGGLLIRVEFLRSDGSVYDRGPDVPVAARAFHLSGRALAYVGEGGERVHGQLIRDIRETVDEFIVDPAGNDALHLVLSPAVFREELERVVSAVPPPAMLDALDEAFDDLQG